MVVEVTTVIEVVVEIEIEIGSKTNKYDECIIISSKAVCRNNRIHTYKAYDTH